MSPTALLVASVFLICLLLNGFHIATTGWGDMLRSPYPVSDAFYYSYAAWFRAFVDPDGGYTAGFIPDSPYVRMLTIGYRILGPGAATPFIVNAVLMSGAAAFVALIGKRLCGLSTGWIAGLGFAFCGILVFYAGITVKSSAEL